ncbi:hypothetical protein HLVA_00660 [Haliovirga abyssi]|uniref:Uncharacterized protein n=1 Tax=Haliovirga abyssi TaxID=2996794 RepID=A0AAU9DI92_9FUSO|nr:hypothetical protein HLVA_00660 [Haliovirga abyssi]
MIFINIYFGIKYYENHSNKLKVKEIMTIFERYGHKGIDYYKKI